MSVLAEVVRKDVSNIRIIYFLYKTLMHVGVIKLSSFLGKTGCETMKRGKCSAYLP